jgi:mycofactocin system transcriptional regulator
VVTDDSSPVADPARRGRRPVTSARELELICLRLFTEQGYEETTIEHIAAAAGVNRRTFFNYFPSKAAVILSFHDDQVTALRAGFAEIGDDMPLMAAIQQVVISVNRYSDHDIPELRARLNLLVSVPALRESAALHYEAWERAVSEFVANRIGQPADSLFPLAIGRTVLGASRTASAQWAIRADTDLVVYLEVALTALAAGFAPDTLTPPSC